MLISNNLMESPLLTLYLEFFSIFCDLFSDVRYGRRCVDGIPNPNVLEIEGFNSSPHARARTHARTHLCKTYVIV